MIDFSEDGFFTLMGEDGDTRDDLKLTDNCAPNTPDAVRDLLSGAEASGERVVVGNANCLCTFLALCQIFTHVIGMVTAEKDVETYHGDVDNIYALKRVQLTFKNPTQGRVTSKMISLLPSSLTVVDEQPV